jgi:CheY-like chemotaxis protein
VTAGQRPVPVSATEPSSRSAKPVVLVAEDDASIRMTLEYLLGFEGFELLFASDGCQALDLARRNLPDVILLDQVMPRMDGRQVYRELKADGSTRAIPVLVLSGMPTERDNDWQGATFIAKPFGIDELVDSIKGALEPL